MPRFGKDLLQVLDTIYRLIGATPLPSPAGRIY